MGRSEESARLHPKFDFDRGQEVVFVTEDLRISAWRAPYCGPTWLNVPRFKATRARLAELEQEVLARCPAGTDLHVKKYGEEGEDGLCTWAAFAAVTNSGPMLAGD